MSETVVKICCMCKKDVSGAKHGKDKRGRYYCTSCFETAKKRAAAAAAQPVAESVQMAATRATTAAPVRPSAPAPAPAPETMPEFCPGCGAKVFANRKRCIKCGGDVLEMQRKAAARPKDADRPATEEVVATWIARGAKVGLAVLVVGVVLFLLYGMKLMFLPGGLWDNYPTTREAAVREFLGYIADGSDKSYDKAFMLISFRERSTNRPNEDGLYKTVFTRMRDDFNRKYGSDWLSKIKLENLGAVDSYPDDEVDFKLTLGPDSYIIATQVQIDTTTATANMTLPKRKKPVYDENGKRRFGILDVSDYKVREKRHMVEIVGSGQPERFDDAPRPENVVPLDE
jgi:hypothetical protein